MGAFAALAARRRRGDHLYRGAASNIVLHVICRGWRAMAAQLNRTLQLIRKLPGQLAASNLLDRRPPSPTTARRAPLSHMLTRLLSLAASESGMMTWNKEAIPVAVALQIGWNLPMDVVGAGVYGGIVKRDEASGSIVVGDEWPENNRAPPAHNPVHSTGPYLDFSKLTAENRGYSHIAQLIMSGRASKLDALLESLADDQRKRLANLVMTGGARPLHSASESRVHELFICSTSCSRPPR